MTGLLTLTPVGARITTLLWLHFGPMLSKKWKLTVFDHLFMVCGHSFFPCDDEFGIDEKEKRKNETATVYTERVD